MQLSLEMAITDQLTGLHNRRYMARHLDNLVLNATRAGKPLAFLIMDIDFFKAVMTGMATTSATKCSRNSPTASSANVRGIDLPAAMAARSSWSSCRTRT